MPTPEYATSKNITADVRPSPHYISAIQLTSGTNLNSSLSSTENLRNACVDAEEHRSRNPKQLGWMSDVEEHLKMVAAVTLEEFKTLEFQEKLWSSQAISSFGRGGAIKVDKLLGDQDLISLLWKLRDGSVPAAGPDRTDFLASLYKKCDAQIRTKLKKLPRLKLYNVFASLMPSEFATLSFINSIRALAEAMGIAGTSRMHPVKVHREVLDRLEAVLGKVASPPDAAGVKRMTLPWLLLSRLPKEADATTESNPDELPGEERLVPLPADRRRRSMMTISGGFTSIRGLLEFAKEGCAREDFKAHIRSFNPRLSSGSIDSTVNALIGEWGVLEAKGEQLTPTVRGHALLENESADPDEVSDWLITRILGFDSILYALREGSATREQLYELLSKANPGWTTDTMPGRLIEWQRALGLIERNANGLYVLTEDGEGWAERIHWIPENLPSVHSTTKATNYDLVERDGALQRPSIVDIERAFSAPLSFPPLLVARLDAGLWSNDRRHFAVLAGLSGAGKTLLARSYALALWQGQTDPSKGLYTVAVQPGWHDPASLFGYINPLASDTYVRTGFLDFLLRACNDPSHPYTVVLDEMNLSHPEQYLAPLLSAMETGDVVELHALDEDVSGVPPRIRYPSNLVIIGTVNMDETTHGLSDKILDRAAVLEFWDIDVGVYPGWSKSTLGDTEIQLIKQVLHDLTTALRPVRLHFGWRTIGDILGYISAACSGNQMKVVMALDHAVFSKILPKLRGEDSSRLRLAFENAHKVLSKAQLQESAAKVQDLSSDLRDTGSARFWR